MAIETRIESAAPASPGAVGRDGGARLAIETPPRVDAPLAPPPAPETGAPPSPALHVVGRPLPKVDALAKTSGETQFADDMRLPRMAYGRLLRSPHPHARIVDIDLSEALALPGVYAAITGRDLPHKYGIMPVSQDETALAVEKVRYVGEPVAAVAAVDEETAEEACRRIKVVYERLPAYMTIDEALTKEGEAIQDYGDGRNIHKFVSYEFGDVEEGFAQADHIREDTFFYQGNTHLPIEQHATLAHYAKDGKLTVWSSTQTPHYVHRELAGALQMPPSRIRIIAAPVGGGFGGKSELFNHEVAAAKLSMVTGRPVKIALNREEVFYAHRGRHPVLMKVKTGVKRDGTITAMHFQSFVDGGAYGSFGVASVYYTVTLNTVVQQIPRYKCEAVRVFTNKPPCGPKRGHGLPQPRYALEIHFDKIAKDLGLDLIDMKLRQTVPPMSRTVNYRRITSCALPECVEAVVRASGFREKHGKLPFGKGIGLATSAYMCGAGTAIYWNPMPHSSALIKLDRSGGVALLMGATDIGQGSDSTMVYLAAEVLGVRPEDIQLHAADTDLTPVDLGSYSSRVTFMMGNAVLEAARKLRAILFEVVAQQLEVPVERLDAANRHIFVRDDLTRSVPFDQAVQLAEARYGQLSAAGSYTPPKIYAPYKASTVGPSPALSFAACVAEVTTDPDTGETRVDKIWIAHDVGRAINPLNVQGQTEGSVYMAIGEVLMEEQTFRRGLHKFPSLLEYKSPTTLETPEIEVILIERPDPEGPFGAKEAGQGPLLPVPPAVANAVFDAVGVRVDETPITPEKVLKALDRAAEGKEPRVGPERVPPVQFPPPIRPEVPPEWRDGIPAPDAYPPVASYTTYVGGSGL
ncbi:MAG TPA: molybdopterin cofactor-binding domain-containing protein [Chloroflexota bacterium]|nr:molybdopterin cofactor-binding domain-containing protein [Chloroflexota bacterium]